MRRLEQLLSSLGYCSRKEAAILIQLGRVTINGEPAKRADTRVDPSTVRVDGEPLEYPDGLLVMLHKPVGCTCTHAEGEGPTIYDLLPGRWLSRKPLVTSVGRLDKDTSGLLLLTDQGQLVQRHTSPKSESEKVYEAELDGDLTPNLIETFASGTLVLRNETKPCKPARLEILAPRRARLTVTEGRYHQVRRMFASQGLHVTALHRTAFGPYQLGDLPEGEWRELPFP